MNQTRANQIQPQETHNIPTPIWSTAEAALYLQIHPRTLARMARHGEIPAFHIGKLWRFRHSDLDAWLENKVRSSSYPCRLIS